MSIPLDSDLSLMIGVEDFGVAATLTPVGSSATTLKGFFDRALEEQETDGALPIIMRTPMFTCRSTDIVAHAATMDGALVAHAAAMDGALIVINSVSYFVREVTDDGTGVSELRLEKR